MAKKDGELTPLMKQYWEIKSLHQDKILLFRMGDFFEMFYDDAVKAAPIIGIALTQRNKKSEDQTPMCGVPHHSIAGPINKLLAAGLKVAICDQIEDPKTAKGIVKRAVTRVLTSGMVYDPDTLESTQAHYMSCLDDESISFIDSSTGEAFFFRTKDFAEKIKLLEILPVVEIVLSDLLVEKYQKNIEQLHLPISVVKNGASTSDEGRPISAHTLKKYVESLADQNLLSVLQPFVEKEFEHRLQLLPTTLRHLEVFSTYRGDQEGSFFQAINRTKTSAGSRRLRQWILFPLRQLSAIEKRLNQISAFRDDLYFIKKIRESLAFMGDVERRLGKIALPQSHARDLYSLAQSSLSGLQVLQQTEKFGLSLSGDLKTSLQLICQQIQRTIVEDAPLTVKQGYMIQKGINTELDEYIELSTNAHERVAQLEQKEKEATGISSLKIRYNNVFGYYIEITHLHKDKVPAHYQRKQTLANAERYYTEELIELEKKVLSAQQKRFDLEFAIYEDLKQKVLKMSSAFLSLADMCSEVDVLSSLAWLSLEESYCRPQFDTAEGNLKLIQSRHPVVEQFQRGKFVANNIELGSENCFLLTGPNMAGKSTLMRQVALTVILAQMGSYVPATEATLPIYDAIYTRIGASDQLSEGLSTFMVEMTETAKMLQLAKPNSLLILDEIGRGTATFDGMCLAQSILEYLITQIKAHVFFATHYHELTALDQKYSTIKNAHMKVHQKNKEIHFLHVLTAGPAGQSYGVQVAELAGLPAAITNHAHQLLAKIEAQSATEKQSGLQSEKYFEKQSEKYSQQQSQLSFFEATVARGGGNLANTIVTQIVEVIKNNPQHEKLFSEIMNYPLSSVSPLQAMNQIHLWQSQIQTLSLAEGKDNLGSQ